MPRKKMRITRELNASKLLELIFTYLTDISSLHNYNEILEQLTNMGRALSGADCCTVWVVDTEREKIWTNIAHGVDNLEIPLGTGIVGDVIRTGKKLIINDVYSDARFNPEVDKKTGYTTHSMMVIPMFDNEDNIIGAFQAINHLGSRFEFNQRDMQRLMLASTLTAETLISVQLSQKLQDTKKKETPASIQILGAYGTKLKGFGTSSFLLNEKNIIDAGNLLNTLEEFSTNINTIWLTHSHLDHISDIAYILDNYHGQQTTPLRIAARQETIQALQQHFFNNIIWPDFSQIPLVEGNKTSVEYLPIEFNKRYEIGANEFLEAFATDHTVASCGYIYTKQDRSILITADTGSLNNVIKRLNADKNIKAAVVECSFPSRLEQLAKESKHLTPSLLFNALQSLERNDIKLYINHIKPIYLNEIIGEIEQIDAKFSPEILTDKQIIEF